MTCSKSGYLLPFMVLASLHCASNGSSDPAAGGASSTSGSHTSTSHSSGAGQGGGLPEPTSYCVDVVAGNDAGGGFAPIVLGTGSEAGFVPFADGQTVTLEWGFQGLQHFQVVPHIAYVKDPLVAFIELIPDQGQNGNVVQVFIPACPAGWAEVQGVVLPLPNPVETVGTLQITVGTCPDVGCDSTKPQYGLATVLGTSSVKSVHVLPPVGPQPGGGGAGGTF